jgi:hypothetical protein
MRYELYDHKNSMIIETDDLNDVAEELGVKAHYLYVRLSAGKGTFVSGKARSQTTLKDTSRGQERLKPGPKNKDYRYAAVYPDEHPGMFRLESHEVTFEEIMRVTKLQHDTLMHKFASHQIVMAMIPEQNSYRLSPVQFKRLKPTPELDAIPCDPQPVDDEPPHKKRQRLQREKQSDLQHTKAKPKRRSA